MITSARDNPSSGTAEPALRWAIVGGGILGLTLAHRLSQRAQDVTLFESAPTLGGLASAWRLGDVVWDRHYHVTLLSDTRLRGLLTELGLEDDMRWVETRTGFYTDGQLYSMSDTLEFLRFPPLRLIDKLRLGGTIFYASKIRNGRRLEGISVVDWLRRWSGRRALDKIWLPLLRAKLGENYRHASAAFIWSTIARMYAARRTGLKKEMFGYVRGGYARIMDRFAQVLASNRVRVETNQTVRRMETGVDGLPVLELIDGRRETFDRVVVTLPAPLASRICPGLNAQERTRLEAIRYQGIVCASLLLKQPLAGYYVTNITDDFAPFTAVIEMTTLVDRAEFGGRALVYLPKYLPADDPEFEISDDEWRARFVAALERMYPNFRAEDVLEFKISRVRNVLAISTLNYSSSLPPMITSVPGLAIVNSAHIVHGTLNANETVRLAEQALETCLWPWAQATQRHPDHLVRS